MKFNADHKRIMKTAFSNYNRLVEIEQEYYLKDLFTVMAKTNLKAFNRGESDFRDFAIKGYIHNLKNKIKEWEQMLAAIEETRNIIDDFENDTILE